MTKKERIAATLEKEIVKRDAINERITELEKQLQAEETLEVQKLMNRADVTVEDLKALMKKASLIED